MDNAPESTASDNALLGGFEPSQQESAAPASTEGQAPQSDSWFGGYSDDFQSLLGKKGLSELSQQEATESLAKSYTNLEAMRGIPDDQLFKISSDMGDDDWGKVYNAMGRPEDINGYSYKAQEGDHPELVEVFLSNSHELGLTDSQVAKLIPALNEKIVGIADAQSAEINAKNNQGLESLQTEWAGAWDQKLNLATRAAEHFGITPEMQEAIKSSGNSAGFIKSLNQIGSLMAEGAMVGMSPTDQKASIGAMSKDEAQEKINSLQGDPDFLAKLRSGDRKVADQASKEMEKYYKILSS